MEKNKCKICYVNFWKDPHNDSYFTKFIEENIGLVQHVKHTDNPDILIASCMGNIHNVKYIKAKCKIFFYGENLNRYPPYNNDKLLFETFDLVVGFKNTDLPKKQIRFPLWLMYYPYYKYNENDNILTYIQSKYDENINKQKNMFATIIARHDRGGQRTIICDELSKYGNIKAPGTYRKNTQSIGNTQNDKINYISRGIYNICPENSCYEGYFTEKIFQAFEGGTIPLYWATGLPEPEIINQNKYCFCDVNNKDELEKSIENVCKNPNKYIEGELFTKNAGKQIQLFYSTLLDNILLCLR
jgi:hypothetical protein